MLVVISDNYRKVYDSVNHNMAIIRCRLFEDHKFKATNYARPWDHTLDYLEKERIKRRYRKQYESETNSLNND